MKRTICTLGLVLMISAGCDPGTDAAGGLAQDAATIPDDWSCGTVVYDSGAFRPLGNDSYRIEPGVQTAGTLLMYQPVDAAYDAIATAKAWGNYFSWTSSVPIRAIITSAGPGKTTVFDYRPGRTSGFGVTAVDATQTYNPLFMLFCFDAPPPLCADDGV